MQRILKQHFIASEKDQNYEISTNKIQPLLQRRRHIERQRGKILKISNPATWELHLLALSINLRNGSGFQTMNNESKM